MHQDFSKGHNYCTKFWQNFKMKALIQIAIVIALFAACTKQRISQEGQNHFNDSSEAQINYLSNIKSNLEDSLSLNDFASIDFSQAYKSKDIQSQYYFLRLGFIDKAISTDF